MDKDVLTMNQRYDASVLFALVLGIAGLSGCMTTPDARTGSTPLGYSGTSGSGVHPASFQEDVVRSQSPENQISLTEDEWWYPWTPAGWTRSTLEMTGKVTQDEDRAKRIYHRAEALYDEGLKAEGANRQRLLSEAASQFKRAAVYFVNSDLEENAYMLAAECHFFLDEYPSATKNYDLVVKKYPNTRHLDTIGVRRFKLAKYWLDRYDAAPSWPVTPNLTDRETPTFDRFGHAVKLYDMIRLEDPTGKLADDATLAAANAHFRQENFVSADRFYSDLRENFPTSQHQFIAHYLGVYCKMKVYQGPEYDGKSLEDAGKLLERIDRQFPAQAQEHRELLDKLGQDIRAAKASRYWYKASYFDKNKLYGGARQYYTMIIKEFPTSNMADAAKRRLAELAGQPDAPAKLVEPLVKWFDRQDRNMPKVADQPIITPEASQR